MWNSKKPWWQRKAKDNNPAENSHYKNWCVIKVAVSFRHNMNTWGAEYVYEYKAVGRANAPKIYTAEGKLMQQIEVDNLTKHEAYCVAKGLNFLAKE
jgi:hypothetical protein